MGDLLFWVLVVACCLVSGFVGWLLRGRRAVCEVCQADLSSVDDPP